MIIMYYYDFRRFRTQYTHFRFGVLNTGRILQMTSRHNRINDLSQWSTCSGGINS